MSQYLFNFVFRSNYGNDPHLTRTLWADHGVYLVNLCYQPCPAGFTLLMRDIIYFANLINFIVIFLFFQSILYSPTIGRVSCYMFPVVPLTPALWRVKAKIPYKPHSRYRNMLRGHSDKFYRIIYLHVLLEVGVIFSLENYFFIHRFIDNFLPRIEAGIIFREIGHRAIYCARDSLALLSRHLMRMELFILNPLCFHESKLRAIFYPKGA